MTIYVRFRDQHTDVEMLTFECKKYRADNRTLEIFDEDGDLVASFDTIDVSWWVEGKEGKQESAA